MKDGIVADSSVAISWAVPSQSGEATAELLDGVAAGMPVVVPVLWAFEVANSLLVLTAAKKNHGRRGRARAAGDPRFIAHRG